MRSLIYTIQTMTNKAQANMIAAAWRKYYISCLPSYAFKYYEGEKYVSTHYMVDIERREKDIYISCLESNCNHPMPPENKQ